MYMKAKMHKNVYEGLNAQKCIWRLECSKMYMKAAMLNNVYEGLNPRSKVMAHMGSEAHVYSSKSTNGGKGLQNSKINSYFTPW